MQRSPTSLLRQSHIRAAQTIVMPSLMLSTSSHSQVEGPYQFTEIGQFCGWPNLPVQPVQKSLVESYQQISSNSDHSHRPVRKKRLTMDQTKSLEYSFAMDDKLEPERKKKLALELGLQPRQVAIWYQNRRARTKTKHLEEKYESLNMQYQDVLKEKKKLEAEVNNLRGELQELKEKQKLGEKGDKRDTMQGSNSMLSTNNKAASFSTMEVKQTQLYVQGKSNQPGYSENNSSESAHNQSTFSTNSPADYEEFNRANSIIIKQAFKPQGMPSYAQQEETFPPDHQTFAYIFDNQLYQHHQQQQQQELFQHFQHQYQLSCFKNIVGDVKLGNLDYLAIPSASLAQIDGSQLLEDHHFKLEDEAAQYLELATQA